MNRSRMFYQSADDVGLWKHCCRGFVAITKCSTLDFPKSVNLMLNFCSLQKSKDNPITIKFKDTFNDQ